MTEPGSRDNDPPLLLGADDYDYIIIGKPNTYSIVRNRDKTITKTQIAQQLHHIANTLTTDQ